MELNSMNDKKKTALEDLKENSKALLKKRNFILYLAFINALYLFALSFIANIIYMISFYYKGNNWLNSTISDLLGWIFNSVLSITKLLSIPAIFVLKTHYIHLLNDIWFSFLVFCISFIFFLIILILHYLMNLTPSIDLLSHYYFLFFFILFFVGPFIKNIKRSATSFHIANFIAAIIMLALIIGLNFLLNKHIVLSYIKRLKRANGEPGK